MYRQQKVQYVTVVFMITVTYHELKYITLLLNHMMQCEYTVLDCNSEVFKGCSFTVIYCFFF